MFKRLLRPTAFKIALLVALAFAVIRWHAQASAGVKGRWRVAKRVCITGKTSLKISSNRAGGKVRNRSSTAWGETDIGPVQSSPSWLSTRTPSRTEPRCRHRRLRTKATMTGSVRIRSRSPN